MGAPRTLSRLGWLALPPLAALAAYHGVHEFGFVFDDDGAIEHNVALRGGDWWHAAFGTYNSLSNRPLACLALSLDLPLGACAMHVVSLLLHAANSVLVALVVGALGARPAIAALAAAIWAVHPLGADAVAYLTQRSMLLMAGFALLAFLALLRSHRSPRPLRWRVLCVTATALALASKEESAGLPLLLMLADRAFGATSWRDAARRWPFWFALACTWLVLLGCVALGPVNPTVGFATIPPATAWEWLLTETQSLAHYLRSVLVPNDLRGVYDFAVVRSIGPALLPGLLLAAAFVATVIALIRRPRVGFAGAVFFVLLAPTSSFFPIITEPCADRRMYLPLLAFVVPLALLAERRLERRPAPTPVLAGSAIVILALLVWQTHGATAIYRDEQTFYRHAYAGNELTNDSFMSGKILHANARLERERGNVARAHELVARAMKCEAPGRAERLAWANVQRELGRDGEAEAEFRKIMRDYPDYADARMNLAILLYDRAVATADETAAGNQLAEAEVLLRDALALAPLSAGVHNSYGVVLFALGRVPEAQAQLERALELDPELADARRNLGIAFCAVGRLEQALAAWQPLLARDPNDPIAEQAAAVRAQLGRR
ncbi:MAG: tetratricopeptide repeat protein [Planctomycetes bacterium]|nr:tetratricopeptide repeat protein [Planctomycetota bacterium]